MVLIPKYQQTVEPVVASYDYIDIVEGTGIIQFNACSNEKHSGEEYFLTVNEPFSNLISSSGSVGSQATFDIDFDTAPLNRPLIIKGVGYVNFTWRVTNSSGTNTNYPVAVLKKWDGSTETVLSTVSGSIVDSGAHGQGTTMLKFPEVTTATQIDIGEQIRVTIGITGVSAGNSPRAHIAHDPQGRDNDWFTTGNFDTTKCTAGVPFRVTT